MVMFQWATLPQERRHGTDRAVAEGRVVQCLAPELLEEIRDLLSRPTTRAKFGGMLTTERIAAFLDVIRKLSEWTEPLPAVFTLADHTKDDHLFNLAIAGKAEYLVTFETRLLKLEAKHPDAATRLRDLAPSLKIVDPPTLATELLRRPQRKLTRDV